MVVNSYSGKFATTMNPLKLHRIFFTLSLCFFLHFGTEVSARQLEVVGLFKDRAIIIIDGKRRVLEKNKSIDNVTLLEANSKEAVLEIDGERKRLGLGTRISSEYTPPVSEPALEIVRDPTGSYQIMGTINGHAVPFLVDTGATLVAINSHTAKRLRINYLLDGKQSFASTAAGVVPTYLVVFDRVRIGDIELRNITGSITEGDFPEIALLGMSFLEKLDVSQSGKVMRLRKKR